MKTNKRYVDIMAADRNTDLPEQFREYVTKEHLFTRNDRLLIAVSGGLDSVVLCELCYRNGFSFDIAHCNYQLRGDESFGDEEFVRALALDYNAAFYLKRFDLGSSTTAKSGIQEKARDLRYQWFEELLGQKPGRYHSLLTAHHAGDQVETVLMNFLKGTGIGGLQGIKPDQSFNGIRHLQRPLLFASKAILHDFATIAELDFRFDSSNNSNAYTRNFLRNEILPALASRIPAVETNLIKNITRFRDANELYQLALASLKSKLLVKAGEEYRIPVLKLQKSPALTTLIYELFNDFNFTPAQGTELKALLDAGSGRYVVSSTHRVLRNRAWLIISRLDPAAQSEFVIEAPGSVLDFPAGKLEINLSQKPGIVKDDLMTASLNADCLAFPLLLRKWKQGDYFYPLGMRKKKKLSRFFIDQKMSLIEKENTWVLESSKRIAWVLGRRIDDRFKITPSTEAMIKITLTPPK